MLRYVVEILEDITAEWDIGEITPETSLGELGLESISLVYLLGEVQQRYELQDRLFEKLRAEESILIDLCVSDVVDDVCELLNGRTDGAAGGEA